MRTFAYCMESVANTVWQATGTFPVACPPFAWQTFDPRVFEKCGFIWLGFHGLAGVPDKLFGDQRLVGGLPLRPTALKAEQIEGLDLDGVVVFATSCHLPETDFVQAFKGCGAQVVGGAGQNFGNTMTVRGADKLGQALLGSLWAGDLATALARAKTQLNPHLAADQDAMQFAIL